MCDEKVTAIKNNTKKKRREEEGKGREELCYIMIESTTSLDREEGEKTKEKKKACTHKYTAHKRVERTRL